MLVKEQDKIVLYQNTGKRERIKDINYHLEMTFIVWLYICLFRDICNSIRYLSEYTRYDEVCL